MKHSSRHLFALLFPACLSGLAALQAAPQEPVPAVQTPSAPQSYPLHGTVIEVRPGKNQLVVKHDDIPGFMPAMTMPFFVEAGVLHSIKPGQVITARVYQKDGDLWLAEVRLAPAG